MLKLLKKNYEQLGKWSANTNIKWTEDEFNNLDQAITSRASRHPINVPTKMKLKLVDIVVKEILDGRNQKHEVMTHTR